MKTKKIVICDRCETKYTFVVPVKPGAYKIECPCCKKEIIFKVEPNK